MQNAEKGGGETSLLPFLYDSMRPAYRAANSNGAEDISCDPVIYDAHLELRQFMFDYVYSDPVAKAEEGKAEEIVRRMYQYYKEHPRKMPEFYQSIAEQEDMDRAVCDYIAGMSDNYIVDTYCNLFIPKSWE